MPYLKIKPEIFNGPCFQVYHMPNDPDLFVDACCIILSCDTIACVPTIFSDIFLIIDGNLNFKDYCCDSINDIASYLYSGDGFIIGHALLACIKDENFVPLSYDDIIFFIDNYDIPF